MSEISKLPWSIDNKYRDLYDANEVAVDFHHLSILTGGTDIDKARARANTDYIVQVANAFPALVSLLNRALRIADDIDCVPDELVQAFITDAKAALALAKGETK